MGSVKNNTTSHMEPAPKIGTMGKRSYRPRANTHGYSSQTSSESTEARRRRLHDKIRRIFCMTTLMAKVCYRMRLASMRKTEQTRVTKLYYYSAVGTAAEDDPGRRPLAFDKALFSRDKGSRLPLSARLVALKLAHLRTAEDMKLMFRIMDNMRSFKERLTKQMKEKICQYATYIRCEQGRVILREGHIGDSFYFIYSGSVFVQVDIMDFETGVKRASVENIIEHGASFGELALLSNDGRRTATVVCREPSELFMIDKAAFVEVLYDIFQAELKLKISHAKQMSIFNGWSEKAVGSLCFQSQLISFPHGKLIETDWSDAQFVYHVLQGKVCLMREIDGKEAIKECKHKLTDNFGRTLPGVASSVSMHDKTFLGVGILQQGDTSECRIISEHQYNLEPVTMVSQGAYVLRFSLKVIHNIAPRLLLEHYLKEEYIPIETAPMKMLQKAYCETASWELFKNKVQSTLQENRQRGPIAMIPATAKGGTGGAPWPGRKVQRLREKQCWLHQEGWTCNCPPYVVLPVSDVTQRHLTMNEQNGQVTQ